jgi:hypothetical protein
VDVASEQHKCSPRSVMRKGWLSQVSMLSFQAGTGRDQHMVCFKLVVDCA